MEAIIANNPKEGKDEFCPLFKIYYDLLPCDNIRMLGDFYYDNSNIFFLKLFYDDYRYSKNEQIHHQLHFYANVLKYFLPMKNENFHCIFLNNFMKQ